MADSVNYIHGETTDLNIAQQNCLMCIAKESTKISSGDPKYWCTRSGYGDSQSISNNDLRAITDTSNAVPDFDSANNRWRGFAYINSPAMPGGWYTGYNYDRNCMDVATDTGGTITASGETYAIMAFFLNSSVNYGSITDSLINNYLLFEIEYLYGDITDGGINVGLEIKPPLKSGAPANNWLDTNDIILPALGQSYFPIVVGDDGNPIWAKAVFQVKLDSTLFRKPDGTTASWQSDNLGLNINILIHPKSKTINKWACIRFRKFNVFTSMPTKAAVYHLGKKQVDTNFVNADGSVNMGDGCTYNKLATNEYCNGLGVGLINSSINNSTGHTLANGTTIDRKYQVQAVSNLVNNNKEWNCRFQIDIQNTFATISAIVMSGTVFVGYKNKSGKFIILNTTQDTYIHTSIHSATNTIEPTTKPYTFGCSHSGSLTGNVVKNTRINSSTDSSTNNIGVSYMMRWDASQIINLLCTQSLDNTLYMVYKITYFPVSDYRIFSYSLYANEFESNYKLTTSAGSSDKYTSVSIYNTAGSGITNSNSSTFNNSYTSIPLKDLIPIYTVSGGLKYYNTSAGYSDVTIASRVTATTATSITPTYSSRTLIIDISGLKTSNSSSLTGLITFHLTGKSDNTYETTIPAGAGCTYAIIFPSIADGARWGLAGATFQWRDSDGNTQEDTLSSVNGTSTGTDIKTVYLSGTIYC